LPPIAQPLSRRTPTGRLLVLTTCVLALLAAALLGLAAIRSPAQATGAQLDTAIATASGSGLQPPRVAPQAAQPRQIVVKYVALGSPTAHTSRTGESSARDSARARESSEAPEEGATTRVLRVPMHASLSATLARLREEKNVVWAVPDYVAHATATFIPNDPGTSKKDPAGGWQQVQWNFDGEFGVGAPEAWANVIADGAPGGSRVVVAVLDTGVAYANRGKYRRSPDFSKYAFVQGYDFIDHTPYPNDHNGHGTFVASTIAEATNNHFGLTGLAYAARIMPVRVLDSAGEGEASTIAEGVRFAVNHGARIINMSLEFSSNVNGSDIPELVEALRYAYRHNVLVVAAAGNEGSTTIPYPARAAHVIAVGATTEHGCLASYSNYGRGITLVAPGGGPDMNLPGDPNCHPELPAGRDIVQMTFTGSNPRVFGFPDGYEGTSMATPHVAATAALIIAAHILGRKPTVAQLTRRLTATARKLGDPQDQADYGAGLLNAAAATAPGGPGAVR
jgi:serine protease